MVSSPVSNRNGRQRSDGGGNRQSGLSDAAVNDPSCAQDANTSKDPLGGSYNLVGLNNRPMRMSAQRASKRRRLSTGDPLSANASSSHHESTVADGLLGTSEERRRKKTRAKTVKPSDPSKISGIKRGSILFELPYWEVRLNLMSARLN